MDIGLGGLIDKIQQFFGERWAKVATLILGLSVSGAALGGFWSLALHPLVSALKAYLIGSTPYDVWFGVVSWAVVIGFSVATAARALTIRQAKRMIVSANEAMEASRKLNKRIDAFAEQRAADTKELRDNIAMTAIMAEEVAKAGVAKGLISQESADSIRSLLGTGSGTQP